MYFSVKNMNYCFFRRGYHFFRNRRIWISESTWAIILLPPIWWSKILWPPPGTEMLKYTCIPKHVYGIGLGGKFAFLRLFSLNNILSKMCNHPIISSSFLWPPSFHELKLWPQLFSWPPSFQKKMITALLKSFKKSQNQCPIPWSFTSPFPVPESHSTPQLRQLRCR